MNVLIIEDEQPTALRLKKLLHEVDPEIQVLDILDTIDSCVKWFIQNPHPDVIFQDIQLADGSSFEIFNQVDIKAPVIFVTAFDQYALQAFKVNSIDYILKPVKKIDLIASLNKLRKFQPLKKKESEIDYTILARLLKTNEHPKRFVVRYGQKIKAIDIEHIAYFYTESGNSFFKTFDNHLYPLDLSLDKLEPTLDTSVFYRINRQVIINYKSIQEMYSYSKSRVRVILNPPCDFETIASTDRSGNFKQWLTGKL